MSCAVHCPAEKEHAEAVERGACLFFFSPGSVAFSELVGETERQTRHHFGGLPLKWRDHTTETKAGLGFDPFNRFPRIGDPGEKGPVAVATGQGAFERGGV